MRYNEIIKIILLVYIISIFYPYKVLAFSNNELEDLSRKGHKIINDYFNEDSSFSIDKKLEQFFKKENLKKLIWIIFSETNGEENKISSAITQKINEYFEINLLNKVQDDLNNLVSDYNLSARRLRTTLELKKFESNDKYENLKEYIKKKISGKIADLIINRIKPIINKLMKWAINNAEQLSKLGGKVIINSAQKSIVFKGLRQLFRLSSDYLTGGTAEFLWCAWDAYDLYNIANDIFNQDDDKLIDEIVLSFYNEKDKIIRECQNMKPKLSNEWDKYINEISSFLADEINKKISQYISNNEINNLEDLISKNKNIDLNKILDMNQTALIKSVLKNNIKITELLLKNNADPNLIIKGSKPVLYRAIWNRNKDLIKLLIKYKANTNIIIDFKTPYEFAKSIGCDKEILYILKNN